MDTPTGPGRDLPADGTGTGTERPHPDPDRRSSRRAAAALTAVATIAVTDLRRVARDRVALFFIVVLPVVLIVFIGTTFADEDGVEVGVLDLDGSEASAALVSTLDRGDGVSTRDYDDRRELRRDVRVDTVSAAVIVPEGYGERLARGEDVAVELIAEPTSTRAAVVRATVRAAVGDEAVRVAAARLVADAGGTDRSAARPAVDAVAAGTTPVRVVTVATEEDDDPGGFGVFEHVAPANLVLFTFVNTVVAGTLIALDRRLGITRRVLSTPHGTGTILAGIGASKLVFALGQSALIMLAGTLLFDVRWGDPLAAALLVVLFASVATAVGLLVGSAARDPDQAQSVVIPVAIGMAMLGGCMWPLEFVPPVMRAVGHLTPHAWAMDAWATLVFDGGGVSAIALELAVLAAFALLLGLLARQRLLRVLTT
jgi:ABC-2 type transport system permease protein